MPTTRRLSTYASQLGAVRDELVAQRERVLADLHGQRPVAAVDRRLDEVHRRRADEAADEEVDRPLVELLRRRDLLELALAHDRDAVAHRHRLDLVVRDVDRRHAELVLQARDLGAHVHAELRVEVRERLVHQVGLGLAHDRAAHRDALALAARERARLALEELRRARARARPRARAGRSRPSAPSAAGGRTRCCRRP